LTEQKFIGWFNKEYDYEQPRRGQFREGVIIKIGEHGITIDVGLKRDGFVPTTDIERLEDEAVSHLEPGQEVQVRIVRPENRDGNIGLSLYQARLKQDWDKADKMLEDGAVQKATVSGYNKGGLLVDWGRLRGFVPGSHLWSRNRKRLSSDQREQLFQEYLGREIDLKPIEVDRDRRRLVLSERLAKRKKRRRRMDQLLEELVEGEVVQGTIQRLCDFGAFVDIGGADGLVHISELAWHYVKHPSEVVKVGDKLRVYVLNLDHKRKRIGLSLKRLQPHPWNLVDEHYAEGQLVSGTVTSLADFGAFVILDIGVEGLLHISELSDPPPDAPQDVVQPGDELVLRILHLDSYRRRVGLSLKEVTPDEKERWLARKDSSQEPDKSTDLDMSSVDISLSGNGKVQDGLTNDAQVMIVDA
jgi:small subunit ribosomal protein S1